MSANYCKFVLEHSLKAGTQSEKIIHGHILHNYYLACALMEIQILGVSGFCDPRNISSRAIKLSADFPY